MNKQPLLKSRRKFIGKILQYLGSLGVIGILFSFHAKRQRSGLPATAIRPPGALEESRFLSACVRCGLCVRNCPFDTLKLAELGKPVTVGTPYFVARDIPCEMCPDIPCVQACPTGALDHGLQDISQADMGLAVFTGVDTCYAFTGVGQCRACYLACPIKGEAISMQRLYRDGRNVFMPTVETKNCTGCGKCEHACITDQASIKVMPRDLVKRDKGVIA